MKKLLPYLIAVAALLAVVAALLPPRNPGGFDVVGFGRLPVLTNGRIKPYDTVARSALLFIQNRQTVRTPDERRLQPIEWLLDVFFRPDAADTYQTFLVDDPDLLALFSLRRDDGLGKRRFSYNQLAPQLGELQRQASLADPIEAGARTRFQKASVTLRNRLVLYQRLKHSLVSPDMNDFLNALITLEQELPAGRAALVAMEAKQPHDQAAAEKLLKVGEAFLSMENASELFVIPPPQGSEPQDWKKAGTALRETFQTGRVHPYAQVIAGLGQTWRASQPAEFNELLTRYRRIIEGPLATHFQRTGVEVRFNKAAPFYQGIWMLALAGICGALSWLWWAESFRRAGVLLVALTWVVITGGIVTRMWLEGRPPITNLYSTAPFIGWAAVTLCLFLERFYRNAVGLVAASALGFVTLLVAHGLSFSGDTLEMMQAVLDSNFWLATHVIVINLGYAATFLAGFLALVYVYRGVLTKSLDAETASTLNRMVYGIVCFATLFSLVGTILGGIWADQSWGRFWGWDPKENGALMIVIWNAIILHARWGGMAKARGIMLLAIFGNVITAWSYFGVNLLGIGLHSYGFTTGTFYWLSFFVLTQLASIALGSMPVEKWRSFAPAAQN